MKLFLTILAGSGGLAVFFLLAYGAFRLLNSAKKKRDEALRREMEVQTDEAERENMRQLILMRQQMDQSTANSVRNERRT